jgi:hypothetical protein
MVPFLASTTLTQVAYLDAFRQLFIDQKDRTAFLDDDAAAYVVKHLAELDAGLEKIDLSKSRERIEEISYPLRAQTTQKWRHTSYDVVQSQLLGLSSTIFNELEQHSFAYIPKSNAQYFEQDALFGECVKTAFPSTASDLKDAGNCLAADLSTAAVFHLMRVAERGMRSLAVYLKVKIEKKKSTKTCPQCGILLDDGIKAKAKRIPLEYAMWDDVLKALEVKIQRLQTPKGKKRDKQYEFYHGLILSLNAFKDVWRNPVSHTRCAFDDPQAQHTLLHVREFMQRLSTKVSEVKR